MITKLKATVIGWYGTETIGDRAILSGILRLLSEVASDITIELGALYPYSQNGRSETTGISLNNVHIRAD